MTPTRLLAVLAVLFLLLLPSTGFANVCCPANKTECYVEQYVSVHGDLIDLYLCTDDLGYGVECPVDGAGDTAVVEVTGSDIQCHSQTDSMCCAGGDTCNPVFSCSFGPYYYAVCGNWNGDYCDNNPDGFTTPYIRRCGVFFKDFCYGAACDCWGFMCVGRTCCIRSIPYSSGFTGDTSCSPQYPCNGNVNKICDVGQESYVNLSNRVYSPVTDYASLDPHNGDGYPNGLWTGVCAKVYSSQSLSDGTTSDSLGFCVDGHAQIGVMGRRLPLAISYSSPLIEHYTGCPPVDNPEIYPESNSARIELWGTFVFDPNTGSSTYEISSFTVTPRYTCVEPSNIGYYAEHAERDSSGAITSPVDSVTGLSLYDGVCAIRPVFDLVFGTIRVATCAKVVSFDPQIALSFRLIGFPTSDYELLYDGCRQNGYYCVDFNRYWANHAKPADGSFTPDGICALDENGILLECLHENIVNDSGTLMVCSSSTVGKPCDSVFDPLTGWVNDSVCTYNQSSGLYECSPDVSPEDCTNGVDDDGDGMVDCQDVDCRGKSDGHGKICCYCNDDCPVYTPSNRGPNLGPVKGKCDAPGGDYRTKALPWDLSKTYTDESGTSVLPNCPAEEDGAGTATHTCYWRPCTTNDECDQGYCCTAEQPPNGPGVSLGSGECVPDGYVTPDGNWTCDPPGGVAPWEPSVRVQWGGEWLGEALGLGFSWFFIV